MKMHHLPKTLGRVAALLAPGLLVMASAAAPTDRATHGMVKRSELEIVDCLLPGQVRQLGNRSFLSQRRPIRTTASECSIRGGEYVAYDRADLQSALRIWLQAAESGDVEAQTNVGEIYERGMGVEPDYEAAAMWYQKAADKNYARALFNLGTMYEQGLGVPQDGLKALNLYRQAWGVPEDNIIYASAAQREQDELRKELEGAIAEKDGQLELLQRQLKELQAQLARQASADHAVEDSNKEIQALKKWIEQLQAERRKNTERLAGIPRTRTPRGTTELAQLPPTADERTLAGMNFGRYYAIVIGNQNYQSIESLATPKADAERAARILADRYGFTVSILEDANDITMLKAINDLNAVLKPDDNLLIYYAGHGARLQSGRSEAGYWLPVNAEAPPKDTFWVPNEQITGHLGRLPARRVLVVADSCYAGLLSTDPSYLFLNDKVSYSQEYIKFKLPKRARLLLSSGGDKPVLDEGSGGNSVFARAFLDELESNQGILSSPELFSRIRKRVEVAAQNNKFVQRPEFKSIKGAGHEVGDFFFVPRSRS
ncbi:caspase family protein [Steroidobacter sp. S1-65]|uniref:Caspase family protein n=1 Tax=Steroidobacter gossypii TaxID=2805490 RepID=A0ABS1WTG4_9GAMM|nr:caspase family protein [Steroidobacter gossypii]MBM0104249.1 caspase family protein [Steroidobacter gossypii]